ncbi:hypothetical protein N7478_006184 [Penicillium angulare]|uniref:uncharacterized protein n=1 Tax=Penicillium angulare TaxID=116970 RepID=UPI002541E17B|nr:uncharacterized protein N7478_006184 [Penicillium angulare]KAJ5280812.1 hypothetical protein N7478_006184 [Penicillium angulare]
MDQPRRIQDLADELLNEILACLLEPGSRPLNGKFYLSKNQSNGHEEYRDFEYGESSDLDRFRLVCKRFMRIGTPRKFSRFNLRFSEDGFRRLAELLAMQRAHYVKTVTYLVRPFYQGSGWTPILQSLSFKDRALAEVHIQRLRQQTKLVETNFDLTQLCLGMAAFSALQEIKLLRLQDEADENLLDFIRDQSIRNAEDMNSSTVCFDWGSACSRAVTNLGIALLNSQCTAIRFIGPQISPEATLQLLRAPSTTLAAMGTRLTSLDINFHSNTDLTATMSDLSTVFRRFFLEAKSLVAIHIGFPTKAPLDLDLESIFHNVRWKTLRTLSLQGWRLHADEIISLLRRHRKQLRDFRLCAVYLRPWGLWKNVLNVLREEMERLDRVDLREIDYTDHFDALSQANGIEVFDMPISAAVPSSLSVAAGTDFPDQSIFTPGVGSGFGFSPVMPTRRLPLRPGSLEKIRGLSQDDLGDNGAFVPREELQLWSAWVLSGAQRGGQRSNGNGNGNGHFNAYHI